MTWTAHKHNTQMVENTVGGSYVFATDYDAEVKRREEAERDAEQWKQRWNACRDREIAFERERDTLAATVERVKAVVAKLDSYNALYDFAGDINDAFTPPSVPTRDGGQADDAPDTACSDGEKIAASTVRVTPVTTRPEASRRVAIDRRIADVPFGGLVGGVPAYRRGDGSLWADTRHPR